MKKIIAIALLAILSLGTVVAQDASQEPKKEPRQEYIMGEFKNNWFMSAGIGYEGYAFDGISMGAFPKVSLTGGKWFNTYLALQVRLDWAGVKGTDAGNGFTLPGETDFRFSSGMISGNVMINLTSAICGHRQDRFYEIIPFAGMGLGATHNSQRMDLEYQIQFGLANHFRLSNSWYLNLELMAAVSREKRYGGPGRFIIPLSATVGATYNFGGKENARKFDKVEDSRAYLELETKANSLEEKIKKAEEANNNLTRENRELKRKDKENFKTINNMKSELVAVKKEAAAKASELEFAPTIVFFNTESSRVYGKDVARLKYAAEAIKKQPNAKFIIEGYADSSTGTADYNQALSIRRAEAIRTILIEEYGVNADQLQVEGKGGVDYLFETYSYNRSAIVNSAK